MREEVPAVMDGERLDRVVATLTGLPRSRIATLVADGELTVDGSAAKGSSRVTAGQVVELPDSALEEAAEDPKADPDVEFAVVHADADVIVVDKPAGLVVHPGAGNTSGTLVDGLLARFPEVAGVGERHRPGIVHRLDKGTSGLMCVARSERAYGSLVGQLKARTMSRRYLALVWGRVEADRGVVDAPLGRSERSPLRRAVATAGQEARTGYEVRARWTEPEVSLVECRLETGRTHQIRVHMAAIGHAVVGDSAYRGGRQGFAGEMERPFLHAWKLAFEHPDGSGERRFASALPSDLHNLLPERVDLPLNL
jgi:23S rRNA pseudouridine1911/1915/1917 synthase